MGSSSKKKNIKKSNHVKQYRNDTKIENPSYWNKDGWMELNIRSTNKKSLHSTIKHEEHVITMHPSDAKLMHLSNKSQVLILSYNLNNQENSKNSNKNQKKNRNHHDNKWISFAAICSVNVIDIKTNKNKIKEGNAQISPKMLEDRLFRTVIQTYDQNNQSIEKNPLQSPSKAEIKALPIQTPSPSKSKFSFAIGGGGDQMLSPSSSSFYTPPNKVKQGESGSTSKSIPNSKTKILLFPFQHKSSSLIANQITNRFIYFSASSITLQLSSDNSNTNTTYSNNTINDNNHSRENNYKLTLKGNEKILEKLASASLYDIFLQKDDLVQIPYQGIKRMFQVISITNSTLERKQEMTLLNKSFTELTLEKDGNKKTEFISIKEESNENFNLNSKEMIKEDDFGNEYNSSDFVSKLVKVIQSGECQMFDDDGKALFPILFHVGYNTKFHFRSPDERNSEIKNDICIDKSDLSLGVNYEQKENTNNSKMNQRYPNQMNVGGLSLFYEKLEITLENPLFRPWLYQNKSSALRPPKGLLLYGPSGVGKTMLTSVLARNLSRKAKSLQMDFNVQHIYCQNLISSSIVGENEKQLSSLFQSISTKSTSLLILDDIHLICPRRGQIRSSTDQLASTLLSLMDGIDAYNNIVIIGITRIPSDLDPALRRPGRLDVEIEIPIPDDMARADIWKTQLSYLVPDLKLEKDDWMTLSKKAKGFTGADTLLAIKEAIRSSMLLDPKQRIIKIRLKELEQAIKSILPSTLRTSKQALVEIPKVKWSDIGGMEEPKSLLREAISLPLTHPEMFEKLNIPPPRGVLLYGPPGCSKTLLARALATEGQMNFISVKGPELLSKWLGESERALAGLFRRARQASPCVIFFDEMDAIAGKRGGSDGGGGERMLSQLLTELDGVQQIQNTGLQNHPRVVVVGATNRPDLLDEALMRPGRMDRKIYVGVPDKKSREKILDIGLKGGKCCGQDVNIVDLANDCYTGGFSGAEIVAICREAALHAIEEDDETTNTGKPTICMRHLMKSIWGMKRQITPEMLDFYTRFRNGTL